MYEMYGNSKRINIDKITVTRKAGRPCYLQIQSSGEKEGGRKERREQQSHRSGSYDLICLAASRTAAAAFASMSESESEETERTGMLCSGLGERLSATRMPPSSEEMQLAGGRGGGELGR